MKSLKRNDFERKITQLRYKAV